MLASGTNGVPSSDRGAMWCPGVRPARTAAQPPRWRRHHSDGPDVDQEDASVSALDNSMERTRFFRRPVVWVLLVILGAVLLSQLFTGGPDYHRVETSVALDQLNKGGIEKVV